MKETANQEEKLVGEGKSGESKMEETKGYSQWVINGVVAVAVAVGCLACHHVSIPAVAAKVALGSKAAVGTKSVIGAKFAAAKGFFTRSAGGQCCCCSCNGCNGCCPCGSSCCGCSC